jgi:L-2-hydroxyglutarate oxidase LhgO
MAVLIPAVLEAPLPSDQTTAGDSIDICIVGAGVIGLALARELVRVFPSRLIVVLEQHSNVGMETSSHNSEVIHAGIYYAPGSLKARCCVRGKELLYDYCNTLSIPYKRTGKLIVANRTEQSALEEILQRAHANGVNTLQFIEKDQIAAMEPNVHADIALWSPETGIIDSHDYMQHLLREAQSGGVVLACRTKLLHSKVDKQHGNFELKLQSGAEELNIRTRVLINCAGLHAVNVAGAIDGLDPACIPHIQFIKGSYMRLSGKSPFTHLIYPVPDPAHRGLGIHATLDLGGQCRFGPDIEAVDSLDLSVDPARIPLFEKEIRRYYPALEVQRLHTDYAGIRPRLITNNGEPADFLIQNEAKHRINGLWQLFGMESPGLTASLAVAELVANEIRGSAIF